MACVCVCVCGRDQVFGGALPPAQEQADAPGQPVAQDADGAGLLGRRQVRRDGRVRPPAGRPHLGPARAPAGRRVRRPQVRRRLRGRSPSLCDCGLSLDPLTVPPRAVMECDRVSAVLFRPDRSGDRLNLTRDLSAPHCSVADAESIRNGIESLMKRPVDRQPSTSKFAVPCGRICLFMELS